MKKNYLNHFIIASAMLLISATGNAQIYSNNEAALKIAGSSVVKINSQSQSVDFVKLNPSMRISDQDQMSWLLKQVLKTNPDVLLKQVKKESDKYGYFHYRYKQYYKQVPVEYGVYYVHVLRGFVESANGEFYNNIAITTKPSIAKDAAFLNALKAVPSERYLNANQGGLEQMKSAGELVVLPVGAEYKLAYKFDIYSLQPLKRVYIYIDAHTGKKIKEINRIQHSDAQATAVTAYNGTVTMTTDSLSPTSFRLQASKGFGGLRTLNLNNGTNYAAAVDFTDADNNWNSTGADQSAYDAHYGSEATFDWYLNFFGRNSYDNAGAQINAYVHYSTGFVNAFWDGSQMTYGDGDGVDYTPLTSLDIVGHEITHAVTENTAALVYADESGALNESFSDCFGVAIDYYKNPANANFLMGDQINVNGIPFRNMGDPNQYSNPDCYNGLYWNAPNEVHNNSGVQNFWYYLICMGGSGTNDLGNNYTVNPIGFNDANAIAYRNLSVYLTPNSTYADARFYAIQSAVDLFGSCSDQVIQVTNAWYAVGVGGLFSNAVVAGFNASQNFFCVVPATAYFNNSSLNATSYSWDFGDGFTSTATSPSHNYAGAGNYTVTLIANGAGSCTSTDTIVQTNYITVTNGGGPISPSCTPNTVSNCCGIGITNVLFGAINHSSGNAAEGYKDFTCGNSTTLTAGDPVPITITTGTTTLENVKVWIDYNNDGVFNNITELAFTSNNKLITHSGIVNTSFAAVLNTPLRMRVTDDNTNYIISDPCYNSQNGQSEDYTITFIANTQPPIVDFTANVTTINVGGSVNFTDLTQHAPTAWQWSFAGGFPASSSIQNPVVIYNTLGTYEVTLVVSNAFGQDSITKVTYIHVVNSINMCMGVTSTTAPNGQLYDSGGPLSTYQNGENCSLLIDPGCALSITMTFTLFNTEAGYDYLAIYDGPNATYPVLWNSSGSTLPPPLTANSGKMFVSWFSDGSVIYNGWEASWVSVIGSGNPPVAAFTVSNSNPPLAVPVQFTDVSTNLPYQWLWDFGDGQSSILQNPGHAYSLPGTYQVTLIAFNCISSDTITQSITVQDAPIISANPDSISVNLNCADSVTIPVTIYNTGGGNLVFDIDGTASFNSDTVQVLAFMSGVDLSEEYPNTISAINQYFTKYKITQLNSALPADLQAALQDMDVLLFPEDESGLISTFSPYAAIVQAFVASGKRVVICGSSTTGGLLRIFDMGLFSGSFMASSYSALPLNVLDTTDEITDQIPLAFQSSNATSYNNITNADIVNLVEYGTNDVVFYRNIGAGKAIYLGFDYYEYSNEAARLIANAVKGGSNALFDWIQLSQVSDTVAPGDSVIIYVTISSVGLNAGTYQGQISINSNDPLNPILSIPVNMVVSGPAILAMSDTCADFGLITQYTTATDTISISNNGCDTLHITSSVSSDPAFTANPSVFDVAPGSSQNVVVSFSPLTVGSYSGYLTIYNNDHDTTICLNGSAGAAPVIQLNPTSINVSLNACADSITVPVYVLNTGGSNLNWNVNGGMSNATKNILALNLGADMFTEYPNTLLSIDQYFANYVLTETQTTDPLVLQTLLVNKDILLFPEQESGNATYYSAIAAVVQNFANNGGTVIVLGSDYSGSATRIFSMGLFSGNYIGLQTIVNCDVPDTTDYIVDGIPQFFMGSNATSYYNITNADKVEAVSYTNFDVVTYRNIGQGRAIYIGWDYFDYNTSTQKIIANAVQYSNSENFASWIDVSPTSGNVAPGDSVLVYVTIYSNGLTGGVHASNLVFNSNDPLNPNDTLSVTLNVSFNPCADFTFLPPSTCSGIVPFQDNTINNPTSWLWDFGDLTTSAIQNPTHTYTAAGTYQVKLVACNATACDSIIIPVTITSVSGPMNASCQPQTTAYCCGMGISHVVFNTINKFSLDGSEGYQDFTCNNSTTVTSGQVYPITITTGLSYNENVRVWIDFNNNGVFNTPAEQVFASNNIFTTHTGNITIPITAVTNTPLRMRIADDYYSNLAPTPCTDVQYGQFEDYTVVIVPNTAPPNANFVYTITTICNAYVQFTDISTNNPTSWLWTFGDGDSAFVQNVVHQYVNSGNYIATLYASNANGVDSFSSGVSINVFTASFTTSGSQVMGQPIQFTPNAPGATSYSWTFGDGFFSSLQAPLHTYQFAGTYYTKLVVTKGACTLTINDTLVIQPVGINEFEDGSSFFAFPNPFNQQLQLSYELTRANIVSLKVVDMIGQTVQIFETEKMQQPGKYKYEFEPTTSGIYFVHFTLNGKTNIYKVAKLE